MKQKEIKETLRAIVNTPAREITSEQNAQVRQIASDLGVQISVKPRCNSCWHDAAIQLSNSLQPEQPETQEENTERRYILKPNVDLYFDNIRINALTLTDELAERIIARGFEKKHFVKCA